MGTVFIVHLWCHPRILSYGLFSKYLYGAALELDSQCCPRILCMLPVVESHSWRRSKTDFRFVFARSRIRFCCRLQNAFMALCPIASSAHGQQPSKYSYGAARHTQDPTAAWPCTCIKQPTGLRPFFIKTYSRHHNSYQWHACRCGGMARTCSSARHHQCRRNELWLERNWLGEAHRINGQQTMDELTP